ncbi:hypothetical protein FOMPIDRAFT_1021392 [Fomitopsis schrenkii]|uniref:Uncharacterized protein n=1 Tax=Fomitopsis schrenkii TaxID=2126942 RepID=S8ERL5_FOMSC|nr:hypothetical protein FOMPIDRAFT_1021392 [Fomitopsis schrenkii]
MKYFAALSVLAAIPAMVSGLTVNTITTGVQECEPILFTWVGGQAPYYLSLAPNKDTSAAPIKNFGQLSGTSYTWTVDLALGTSFTTILKDSTGTTALSDLQTVAAGSGSSCVNSTVTETGGSVGTYSQTAAGTDGAASTGGASTVETTSASGNAAAKTSGSASGTKSSAAPTGSATTTGTSGAGRASVGAFGLAALMGLVGAALF